MRRDAALFEPVPSRTGKRSRPHTKVERLPIPPRLVEQSRKRDWKGITVGIRGKRTTKLVLNRHALRCGVNKHDVVRLVVIRDPTKGVEPDDFFVTTGTEIVERYFDYWAIEACFRDIKQNLGSQDPQSFKRQGTKHGRRPLVVAARRHLVLVSHCPPNRQNLDRSALAPDQDGPEPPRRPPPPDVETANYRHVPQPSKNQKAPKRP